LKKTIHAFQNEFQKKDAEKQTGKNGTNSTQKNKQKLKYSKTKTKNERKNEKHKKNKIIFKKNGKCNTQSK
jgi:hypothetical protein